MKCTYCQNKTIYKKQNSYCENHFIEFFEDKVKKTIKDYNLITSKDKIVVACSGGKDSTTILYILNKWYKNVDAIAIDEGVKGYRENTLTDLKSFCKSHSINLKVYSFKNDFGFNLDDVKKKEKLCTVCGVMRRNILNKKAKGYDKLVTGHNLDDECQNVLMNLMKTNIASLGRLGPKSGIIEDKKFVPRVKPLYLCGEKEVLIYTHLMKFGIKFIECPYALTSFRSTVRDLINLYEQNHPGTKKNIINNFLTLLPSIKEKLKNEDVINYCNKCGEPCRQNTCRACLIVKNFNK